nr:MoaD/ThiS family protein [uncultured Cetobacterium sp.]
MLEIRFFATLRKNRGKVQEIEFHSEITGEDIIKYFQIEKEEVSLFLVNGFHQPLTKKLCDGDIISIFPPVGGG